MLTLWNTRTRRYENFQPLVPGHVGMYGCGPTVYAEAHLGNLRTYVFEDILRRVLQRRGYDVKHIMNITDVGHLQSDSDDGDDKMQVAATREHKSPWDIARFYEDRFFQDTAALNILKPSVTCRATEHIAEMIALIQRLEAKGHTYTVDGNVYFDVSSFPSYADLARLKLDQDNCARVDLDPRKRNACDFVLWFSESKYPNQIMKWDSPWGTGFPGWHIECSAMAMKYLGPQFDIHCGGIDHIAVHHTNEIAQSEAALGLSPWVQWWMHGDFLTLDCTKMSKSAGCTLTLSGLDQEGFDPLHFRFFCLNSHYRSTLSLNFDILEATRKDMETLKNRIARWERPDKLSAVGPLEESLRTRFDAALDNDLDTSTALVVFREVIKSPDLSLEAKWRLIEDFDTVLGLGVTQFHIPQLTAAQRKLVEARTLARQQGLWPVADQLRQELAATGILLNDDKDGTTWYGTRCPISNADVAKDPR